MNTIKQINKLIKPYIAKRKNSYCTILIPLREWDEIVEQILFVLGQGKE